MDIKNLIEELEYILEIFKKPIPINLSKKKGREPQHVV